MQTRFATVNGPFYRVTVSAFLYSTPGGLMLPMVTGAGCEAAAVFLAHHKDGFDFTS